MAHVLAKLRALRWPPSSSSWSTMRPSMPNKACTWNTCGRTRTSPKKSCFCFQVKDLAHCKQRMREVHAKALEPKILMYPCPR